MGVERVWFSEHHFRPVWFHNNAADVTLVAVRSRTTRVGVGVVLAPLHHPLPIAACMAALDMLSPGQVGVGIGGAGGSRGTPRRLRSIATVAHIGFQGRHGSSVA
jgi:alkanesulfonate monooxygenase SsuD/methylene tetrahydromethanopterin reductase-like flavin-dependent oxidoreductase (luciferase family)